MAKGAPAASSPTTATPPSRALKRTTSSTQNMKSQKSILGFFQKSSPSTPSTARNVEPASSPAERASVQRGAKPTTTTAMKKRAPQFKQDLTPVPSSDLVIPEEEEQQDDASVNEQETGTSPSRRARKKVNYLESDTEGEEDDEKIFRPGRSNRSKRQKLSPESEDEFKEDADDAGYSDYDIDDFIVADESDEEVKPAKRRAKSSAQSKNKSSPLPLQTPDEDEDLDLDIPETAGGTALKWKYDPESTEPRQQRTAPTTPKRPSNGKQKAHVTEPEQRYAWLANLRDIDGHPIGHPEYDPRTLYIPPLAWSKFSPFEKQYWEIKQKFWDTVVFFKKGKFYELYENDATIGHQLFDLKLTDRVNMRMVGVPEMSLDHWANQFVAKGFKIARVDQIESALGKEMRERDGKKKAGGKEDKVIRRELSCVLTAGTLVEGSMLQDDMSTYCVAIKEALIEDRPAFGLAFVDTATGQFFLSEFVDDVDMTKFETFVAQTRPQELLLEKSTVSAKALRILKNNTGPTTIWNYLKPAKEFWEADITVRELDASDYFVCEDGDNLQAWPEALREARDKELVMSAFGALVQYLRILKLDRDLITIGNFSSYDPIKKASSLVLDGQTLINMEIFANSFDGTSDGTLFQLLNRCITPFGKRMFKQWVCHPLVDANKINARLDAVDALNADSTVRDQFSSQLTKMPDLERLISRIHAANCKAQDFARVLEGFEQIEYTMSLLKDSGSGEGVIGQLINAMPDLNSLLEYWKTAFDRTKAKENGILVPKPGVEEDFDNSQEHIEEIHQKLENLLKKYRRELGSTAICYRDNGKEIYQLEVPIKVKNIPKNWDQMSATKQVKRYYFPELRALIRQLQEAQETHSQIVKEVAGRFYARFDENYTTWLAAVRIVSQLDCLISLAKASSSLGHPSCRPVFVNDERSVLEFEELRHPCLLSSVDDFIPNDVRLGGPRPNIDLLTGANAAGKSTVLRMTCIAVIMAQIGCYLPCTAATLTPVDRIMSRLGANDNIFAAQSTFFVELSETKKILSEATPRSLVILDELGRGTSSYDGVAVAQAVLHHVATHIGALGFFATHYHSLAAEFEHHPEIAPKRMKIDVDEAERRVTFLYKLEPGVAEGSFGMHCASMCGIPAKVIERAEVAAKQWEHTSRLTESLERRKSKGNGTGTGTGGAAVVGMGWWSDVAWALRESASAPAAVDGDNNGEAGVSERSLEVLRRAIEAL
ncbi:mismatch repair ATPase MSH6 [Aspergillus homomorphus CBS 101889]|uniref:DNA mismatch repair protein n=1 Tax=Aspergillus homomorphus (strain CBS 101889) TaxID=1450537 RepID=A0A395I7N8_ASPHC|nr:DNA mismatch repair protein Msh6 [Aspergillus homomorphus CBS 101889]RAL15956.1 DNA mismatch repair protein Msh6 [Aspergillus homomorphus CBS 101889]